jgi:hypothetical protein
VENEVIDVREVSAGVPAIADDTLIRIAKDAESRIDAVVKIKQLALKVTNASDWTDQQGKPYLQASGAEKVANLFNISWGFLTPEPLYEEDEEGHYTFTFKGHFSMGGRSIEIEGSRSSRDKFFMQYDYPEGAQKTERKVKDRDNKRDVKMAALTNLLGNGITRILGIRNLTWDDLMEFAKISQEDVKGKVNYKKDGKDKPPIQEPQKKNGVKDIPVVTTLVLSVEAKKGEKNGKPYTIFGITAEDNTIYKTFSDTFADLATTAKANGNKVKIAYAVGKYGNDITALVVEEK